MVWVTVVGLRRGAVVKESLTHLPPSWLRPPTPIPCTPPTSSFPYSTSLFVSSLSLSLYNRHHTVPFSLWLHLLGICLLLLLLLAAACQVACLLACLPADQVVPNTTKSIYLRCTQQPIPVFLPLAPFQTTPLRGTDPHIDRGANPLRWKGSAVRSRPARCK